MNELPPNYTRHDPSPVLVEISASPPAYSQESPITPLANDDALPSYHNVPILIGARLNPRISPFDPILSQIMIKSLEASRVSSRFGLHTWIFEENIPDWYITLDTIEPGWMQGIQQCNQVLRVLAVRRALMLSYRIILLFPILSSILIYMIYSRNQVQTIILGVLLPINFILVVSSGWVSQRILTVKSPLDLTQKNIIDMGWTLQGFVEAHRYNRNPPEIKIQRYVIPTRRMLQTQ